MGRVRELPPAHLVKGRIVLGRAVARPHTGQASSIGTGTVPAQPGRNAQAVRVRWWRVEGILVGSGSVTNDRTDPGSGIVLGETEGKSFAKFANGRIVALSTLARERTEFQDVLFVSREGWLVVRTIDGFAWLYPIPR